MGETEADSRSAWEVHVGKSVASWDSGDGNWRAASSRPVVGVTANQHIAL